MASLTKFCFNTPHKPKNVVNSEQRIFHADSPSNITLLLRHSHIPNLAPHERISIEYFFFSIYLTDDEAKIENAETPKIWVFLVEYRLDASRWHYECWDMRWIPECTIHLQGCSRADGQKNSVGAKMICFETFSS